MNAVVEPDPSLLARLGMLVDCARAEGYACITARHEHGAHAVDIDHPCIAIVLRGRKQVRTHAQALEFAPGDLFLIARRCRMDVVNIPDPDSGLYLTVTIPLCEEVLAAARLLWSEPITGRGDDLARLDSADFAPELQHWLASLQAGQYTEARLALAALTVALCRRGHTAMLVPPPPSLAMRIRDLIRAEPARDWQSQHIETALGLSGATLRRRLAGEGTGLREIIAAARLACAMDLLYTTDWPVKTVAARVGYRSVASFSRRFGERYGLDPARIGNA
ncbi:helix-turn-helix transcriptional regulator [Pseudoxanthomonas sp. z9]|uniref:helix-turn-helix transcriptional regulator n=1 Tax=Pseudoxanthomonas sp. z9 TaxID=2584942 RepID=UPI00114124E5|nr:helix-turn-helix transcriptional regulator [Pseudoxanthomonas sp. z9]